MLADGPSGGVVALSAVPRFVAWVALGGNLGDVPATMRSALGDIACLPGTAVLGVSALFETEPWEAQGPVFHNAVAAVSTALGPEEFLQALLGLEASYGRDRPYVHAPRTLDLDVLAHGGWSGHSDRLTLPHPRAMARAFVLGPWAELRGRLALSADQDAQAPEMPSAHVIAQLCASQAARQVGDATWAELR